MLRRVEVHRVTGAALLTVLGGFEEARTREFLHGKALPRRLISEIRRVARKPRANSGGVEALGERFGRPPRTISVMVSRLRSGYEPRYWKEVE